MADSSGATADVTVDVHDRPLRVLFVNGRPSWATRFIERALDRDPRFSVSTATRVSRGLTATSASAPASLATSDPDSFHAIVLGAPELLTKAEADILRGFVRVRGGLLIVAPDRMIDQSSPLLDLLPARKFTERLLDDPAALAPMFASEFAVPDALCRARRRCFASAIPLPVRLRSSALRSAKAMRSSTARSTRGGIATARRTGSIASARHDQHTRRGRARSPSRSHSIPSSPPPDAPIEIHVRARSSSAANATATIAARLHARSFLQDSDGTSTSTSTSTGTTTATPDSALARYTAVRISWRHKRTVTGWRICGVGHSSMARQRLRRALPGPARRPDRAAGVARTSGVRGGAARPARNVRSTRSAHPASARVRPAGQHSTREASGSVSLRILPFAACLGGEWLLRRRRGER